MPTKYVILAINGDHINAKPIRIIELENLQENGLEV
jgi:hypothetical protein